MRFRKIEGGNWWQFQQRNLQSVLNSGRYAGRENCISSQGAHFEGDWGIIVLCKMFLLSCIFFNKCLFFIYMAGYFLDKLHTHTHTHTHRRGGVGIKSLSFCREKKYSEYGHWSAFTAYLLKCNFSLWWLIILCPRKSAFPKVMNMFSFVFFQKLYSYSFYV